jgi:NAD(P)-dependent dehydrogenase (short-subunit alcohol dehydrogenase family)
MDLGFKARAAIVTGVPRVVGREAARQFLEEGVRVMICGRTAQTIEQSRAELVKQCRGGVRAVVAHMTEAAGISKRVDAAKQKFGTIDISINNAGRMYSCRLPAITDADLKEQFATKNLRIPVSDTFGIPCHECLKMGPHHQHHRRCRQRA